MLAQLRRKLNRQENQDVRNITLRQSSAYALPFNDGTFDLVCMITVLPEIPARGRALAEVKRVLKSGGILAVTEFLPDPDYPLRSTTLRQGVGAGFEIVGVFGNFWDYMVRFRKPA